MIIKNAKQKRIKRVRSKIHGTKDIPRLTVFRSNKYLYAQLVNDDKGESISGVSEKVILAKNSKLTKKDSVGLLGEEIAKIALKENIKEVVFDRSGYKYHGKIKALADGARKAGLKF